MEKFLPAKLFNFFKSDPSDVRMCIVMVENNSFLIYQSSTIHVRTYDSIGNCCSRNTTFVNFFKRCSRGQLAMSTVGN
ncbi:uncharacterized protein LOC143243215 isoform X2 [Tachypleus tridentatus]|uniref:uncharacterized protein LOC143243215 isoform X2 n=1 Tax=Tachypleus tridentatus TaxID=6853 RepID=UPI003FCF7A50